MSKHANKTLLEWRTVSRQRNFFEAFEKEIAIPLDENREPIHGIYLARGYSPEKWQLMIKFPSENRHLIPIMEGSLDTTPPDVRKAVFLAWNAIQSDALKKAP